MPPFLSTLSLRRATFSLALYSPLPANFYPRSPCGERLMELHFSDECGGISIHALLAESDLGPLLRCGRYWHISIHALLAESDCAYHGARQSMPHFYPRSPCGERLQRQIEFERYSDISIHALLAESDSAPSITPTARRNFYPRSPCGERRHQACSGNQHPPDFYPRSPCGERPGKI